MESLLNILWVCIALAALVAWRMCWMRQGSGGRRDSLREWTAFSCALVAIFFAVSLSDDLHADRIVFDEASATRRHSAIWSAPHNSLDGAKGAPFVAATIPGRGLPPWSLRHVGNVAAFVTLWHLFPQDDSSSSRAPPFRALPVVS